MIIEFGRVELDWEEANRVFAAVSEDEENGEDLLDFLLMLQ